MDHIENPWRRLDMTFIHLACIGYSFALSKSPGYAALSCVVNAAAAAQLWERKRNNRRRNNRNIMIGVITYLLPMAWRFDLTNLLGALVSLAAASLVFIIYPFGGWR